jgi:hypothetical protein
MNKSSYYSIAIGVLLAAFSASAGATVVQYSDRSNWAAAAGGALAITNHDFSALTPTNSDTGAFYSNAAGLTDNSVNFVGFDNGSSGYDLKVVDDPFNNWGSGAFLQGPARFNSFSRIEVTFGAGVYSVGSDIMYRAASSAGSGSFNIVLSTGATIYSANTSGTFASRDFAGFISDTPITSIFFYSQSPDNAVLDNFATAGQVAEATPETATLLLCGTGLIVMVWICRRKRSAKLAAQVRA